MNLAPYFDKVTVRVRGQGQRKVVPHALSELQAGLGGELAGPVSCGGGASWPAAGCK